MNGRIRQTSLFRLFRSNELVQVLRVYYNGKHKKKMKNEISAQVRANSGLEKTVVK